MLYKLFIVSVFLVSYVVCDPYISISNYDLIWYTPSVNSTGSMPLGNGELGMNLWVEEATGDVLFLISRTDSWDEDGRLLKIGRIRIALDPNPFFNNPDFVQRLDLQSGLANISANGAWFAIFSDANYDAIRIQISSVTPTTATITSEIWRTEIRNLTQLESGSAFGLCGEITVYPDVVVDNTDSNEMIWYHRNRNNRVWSESLEFQGLGNLQNELDDPILNRTFGALVTGPNLRKVNGTILVTSSPLKEIEINVYTYTNITSTVDDWITTLKQLQQNSQNYENALSGHLKWWSQFWDRSWIEILPSSTGLAKNISFTVTQNYLLQRFMDACSGRGHYAIKFNGLIFTVDLIRDGQYLDPDYRQWGGGYWFQNTRHPYWSLMTSGDFEMALPLFKMYGDMIPLSLKRSQIYFGHNGVYFPETSYFFGGYTNYDYGCDRNPWQPNWSINSPWERYHYEGGLDLLAIELEYYLYTQDDNFMLNTVIPMATNIMDWYLSHYPLNLDGQIVITPSQAIETYQEAMNPADELAGLKWNIQNLLQWPKLDPQLRQQWTYLASHLIDMPNGTFWDGTTVLFPAQSWTNITSNMENPELYSIFPFRLFNQFEPNLDLAINTFKNRRFPCNVGWCQDVQEATLLGLVDQAGQMVVSRFTYPTSGYRFPTFWGQFFDWIPEEDHGAGARTALQWMITQPGSEGEIIMFPTWPAGWDVDFRLHGPMNTIVEGTCIGGKLLNFKVTPPEREKAIKWGDSPCSI